MNGLSFENDLPQEELDKVYIRRCIDLAKRGGKSVRPNPQVGAVLVHRSIIIGEGYHQKFGDAHAEVNCLLNVADQNRHLIPQSTLYVSLEPCNIIGKTPACSDLILKEQIPEVVVGALDPNPLVNGSSLKHLVSRGVSVRYGICKTESEALIRPFCVNQIQKRPYVILKMVKSGDNFIGKHGEKIWLSNTFSNILSHKWRAEVDAIMAGTTTVLNDDPSLTTRLYPGENPIRIILDETGKIPPEYKIYSKEAKTWVITEQNLQNHGTVSFIQQDFGKENFIASSLEKLFSKGVYVLLVEGGAKLIQSFISSGIWDEARIITCPQHLGAGIAAPNIKGQLIQKQLLLQDELQIIYNEVEIPKNQEKSNQ
jgi:diaminohydroxyphosphoribosylaminopyrimidine deaminase / 5-amino-6-(5-phosphoribosylamino)uracil reductase